ncbi:MAG: aminofutalosine synthase MqnE [Candidatus Melainabacteria bacterium]|nr:aminofutalosine synthase MqnE [Candidatus Melainabacteria bacterium]
MFSQVKQKILNKERIAFEEGVTLYKSNDLLAIGSLGRLARDLKTKQGQEKWIYWNRNMHLNPTNVCIARCEFCAFAKLPNEKGAWTYTIDEALEKVRKGAEGGANEVHIVGGLNPKAALPYYTELLKAIKNKFPALHIKGFTAVEIDFFSKLKKISHEETLKQLIDAGLDSMPGGGAEIFSKSVRNETCPDKIPASKWLEIHGIAHKVGLKTNATMLCGIGENVEDRVDHMVQLREQQDKTNGFQTFIPLSCHYEDTEIAGKVEPLTAFDQLKNIAISRIMLDNFDHIKAYWIQLGVGLAQVSLNFGADDLDGTVQEENITHAAGAEKRGLGKDFIQTLIEDAGYTPVERDTVYNVLAVAKH